MSYSSVVLGDSPSAYWELQETSGTTAADASGNSDNGTYTGGYTLGQTAPPMGGDSVLFDGTSGYVKLPTDATLDNLVNNFSIEGWVKVNSWTNGGYWGIIGGAGLSGQNSKIILGSNGTNWKLTKYGVVDIYIGTVPNDTNWHHVVATYSSTAGVTLYVDGTTSTYGGNSTNTANCRTGTFATAVGAGEKYLNGYLAHVAVYPTVLTATQVQNHYNAATSSSPTPITANGAFQGQGSLSATANIVNPATINATASFTGQGSLTATANLISPVVATASMQGQGSLTVTGNGVWLGSANLTGQGSLSSNPVVVLTASASLSGQGSLTAVVELQDTSVIGTANFYGSSSVVSNPTVSKAPILATANMQGQGILTATVEVIDIGVANLQGTSYLMANAVLPSQVQVPKVWNVVFDPKKSWTGMFDKTVHTWTVVFDPKKVWVGGE